MFYHGKPKVVAQCWVLIDVDERVSSSELEHVIEDSVDMLKDWTELVEKRLSGESYLH